MDKKTIFILIAIAIVGGLVYYFMGKKTETNSPPKATGGGTSVDLNNGLELITSIVGLFGNGKDDDTNTDYSTTDEELDNDDLDDAASYAV